MSKSTKRVQDIFKRADGSFSELPLSDASLLSLARFAKTLAYGIRQSQDTLHLYSLGVNAPIPSMWSDQWYPNDETGRQALGEDLREIADLQALWGEHWQQSQTTSADMEVSWTQEIYELWQEQEGNVQRKDVRKLVARNGSSGWFDRRLLDKIVTMRKRQDLQGSQARYRFEGFMREGRLYAVRVLAFDDPSGYRHPENLSGQPYFPVGMLLAIDIPI